MEQMGYSFNYGLLILVVALAALAAGVVYFTRTRRRSETSDSLLYIEALQAMVAGEDSTAFSKLKEVVAVRTDNLDAYIQLGDILRKHKKIDRATRVHQELTLREGLTNAQRRAIYRSLTLDYIAGGNVKAAEQALGELLKIDKSDLWAAERLVRVYEDDGRWEEAFKMRSQIDRRLGHEQRDLLALYKTYAGEQILKNTGDKHKARLAFKDALNLDKMCLPAYLGIGETYFNDQRLEDAVEWWLKILEIQPRAGHLVFERLKKAYFELGQFGEMTRVFEKTLENDAKNLPAMSGLAEIARKKGDRREAESHYRRMLEIDSDNITARAGLIATLKDRDETDAVIDEIDHLLQTLPFRRRGYRCRKCSYKSFEPIWRCPECKSFNSFKLWHDDSTSA